jgi:2-oxoglutarate/2-oxoacid ferredoxin oxidoreductase subunit alpha
MKNNRIVIKVAGESGQGVNSVGEMLCKGIKRSGYWVFGYREYPSLIRGGYSNYQIDFSDKEIQSSSIEFDLCICQSRLAVHRVLPDISENGVLIHNIKNVVFKLEEKKLIEEKKIRIEFIDAALEVEKMGAAKVMANTHLVGIAWRILGLDKAVIAEILTEKFEKKPEILHKNIEILDHAFSLDTNISFDIPFKKSSEFGKDAIVTTGNHTMSLGAISAGVRAYITYPMTPASSILTYLASVYKKTEMLIKQAEDEITAVQMVLGAMHMGTRALVGTSGGGFDLMTETITMAALAEIPLVIIIAQRPGPATGVPTYTAAGDLDIAVYSGHGEYPRCVLAASDGVSAYETVQKAFNISEKYQIPVILLTEKQIGESLYSIEKLPEPLEIERGLVQDVANIKSQDRYKLTENGVSPRWIPGSSQEVFFANGDEHKDQGVVTEDPVEIKASMEKRMRKLQTLKNNLDEPVLYGEQEGDILFVGWGSVKGAMVDVLSLQNEKRISYLHYEVVYPVQTEKLLGLAKSFSKVVLVENNMTGQLGKLIKIDCGFEFDDKFLKYDSRPFFFEDVLNYIAN